MSEIKFGNLSVLGALSDAVKEMGEDYVYPDSENGMGDCYYNKEGCPQCIVGKVFTALVPAFQPRELHAVVEQRHLLEPLGFSKSAILILQMAQAMQDQGETWGTALRAAREMEKLLHHGQLTVP